MESPVKYGVLLVNLGTPDSPSVSHVRKYLREFLMDGRVIDIPVVPRWLLVNGVIAPFRAPKSAKIYKQLWTTNGSPLKYYGLQVEKLLQETLGNTFKVSLGMRYQQPSIKKALQELQQYSPERIIVIPLFPQYASATTGSVHQEVMSLVKKWQIIPEIHFVHQFYDHPLFIKAFVENGRKYIQAHEFDHFLFTYHGLPERQIRKADHHNHCLKPQDFQAGKQEAGCCAVLSKLNRSCYRAQCFTTTLLLASELGLPKGRYTTSFQSRLGKDPWIQPYTEDVIKQLAKEGKKNILVFSPSFIADCLETTIEVGEEYKEVFEKEGGHHWQLVESLNDSQFWIKTLEEIVLSKIRKSLSMGKVVDSLITKEDH